MLTSVDSGDLNTNDDFEPTVQTGPLGSREVVWDRKFAMGWSSQNRLILARTLVHQHESNLAKVILKIGEVSPDGEFLIRGFATEVANLDLQGGRLQWTGVTELQISPSGHFVLANITELGLRGVRLGLIPDGSPLLPSPGMPPP